LTDNSYCCSGGTGWFGILGGIYAGGIPIIGGQPIGGGIIPTGGAIGGIPILGAIYIGIGAAIPLGIP